MVPEEQKNVCCATLKMKRIDILVSTSDEVQKERIVAEQSIRYVAAELGVPVSVQNTDLATSQRSALETELKKAREEKAQLAQQNANRKPR